MFKEYTIQITKSSAKLIKSFPHNSSSSQENEQINVCDKEKIIQSVTNLHKNSTIAVLNYLIPSCYKMKSVWFGYKYIANQLGFCERTVQRAVHELRDLGLLQVQYRLMTSNLYKVNPQVYIYKEELKHKIPSLWGKFIILSLSLLVGNVVPSENKNCLSLVSKSMLVRRDHSGASLQERDKKFNKVKKRVVDMVTNKPIISPTLRQITQDLYLTKHGQCKLLTFTDEILQKVWMSTSKEFVQTLPDPFNWIVKRCIEESTALGVEVDWNVYYLLLKTQNISKTQSFVQQKKKEEPKNIGVVVKSSIEQRIPEWQRKYQNKEVHSKFKDLIPEWCKDSVYVN